MNKSYSEITLRTKEPMNFIIDGDTIMNLNGEDFTFIKPNNTDGIDLQVFNEKTSQKTPISKEKSPWYWGNSIFIGAYVVGAPAAALVDEMTGKKWTYPRRVYIDPDNREFTYLNHFPMDSSYLAPKNRFSFTLLSPVELYHPGYEFSYLRHHNTESATQITYSFLTSRDDNFSRNAEGFEVGLEHKIYLRNSERIRLYSSISVDHLNKNHEAELSLYIPEDNTPDYLWETFQEDVTVEKRFFNLTPRFGAEYYISKHLVFEAFAGLGARYRRVRTIGIDPDLIVPDEGWFWSTASASNANRTNLSINFDANFRIGFQF